MTSERPLSERVSVCIPCRNEERTVGPLVKAVLDDAAALDLVDELIVIDDRSTDATAASAAAAGAAVFSVDAFAETRNGVGKGNAMWAGVQASVGDIIVWLDGDLRNASGGWITELVTPLLADPSVELVKATFVRPTDARGQGGGRTTELVARPLLAMFFPDLAALDQPLVGEAAVRRSLVEDTGLACGWGVEIALLIDTLLLHGASAIRQADLGTRHHRHRPVRQLSQQAAEIMATVLLRAGLTDAEALTTAWSSGPTRSVELNLDHRGGDRRRATARPCRSR